jgi:hypothetical protein
VSIKPATRPRLVIKYLAQTLNTWFTRSRGGSLVPVIAETFARWLEAQQLTMFREIGR